MNDDTWRGCEKCECAEEGVWAIDEARREMGEGGLGEEREGGL